jgi:3-dehydroquinate synthase
VVGDLAGFLAATLLRGVRFVQAPTTLLAMVDSAVGGKVGINHKEGKNLIGAFHQPSGVCADLDCLGTLPPREVRAGLAEVVKYGMILDEDFFRWLEERIDPINTLEPSAMAEAVARSCEFKAEVVRQDERESGRRAILNYGHTFAHAFEALTHYRRYRHGEAVAIGMAAAAALARDLGLVDDLVVARQRRLLAAFGLPVTVDDLEPEAIVDRFEFDKKAVAGRPVLVLPERIGRVRLVHDVDREDLIRSLKRFVGA